ncbi:acyltransferase family protein [Novosphingobium sp. NPDC080210]|uniref:acyltransferase family protein n=1 Tax=Novosphingobium sp. NPDC080210 TaxID=3390596 RepID=UPI003D020546
MASTPPQAKATGVIESLQAGRGLAAVAVVAHHAEIAVQDFSGPFSGASVLHLGYLGVDFFFVLSGFIIFHATFDKGKTAQQYAMGRVQRVYLPYLPVGIGMALLYSILPQLSAASRDWAWLPTLTLAPVNAATALSVAWTLKHEILFYTIFGLGYFSGRLPLVLGIWCAAIIAGLLFNLPPSVVLAPINLEFFMGIAVAVLSRRGWAPDWLLPIGAAFFAIWLGLGADPRLSPLTGLAFALIVLPVIRHERAGSFGVPSWLTFLGAASYAIYLVHKPVISVVARIYSANPYGLFALAVLAGTAAGIAYYWLVERRLLQLKFGRLQLHSQRGLSR